MSIHHLEAAAELELHATSKLVLMALADDANKITRITFPGRDKLVEWSGAKERRILQIIEELIAAGLLARRRRGRPGFNAEFIVFPTAEEFAGLKALEIDLNPSYQPVDNSQNVGAAHCTHENGNGCNPEHNGCNPDCAPPDDDLNTRIHQSSEPAHVGEPVDNPKRDDWEIRRPTPKTAFGNRRTLDISALAESVGHVFDVTGIDDEQLGALAGIILGRAKGQVIDPMAYVTKAIKSDPFEWQSQAFDLVTGRAEAGGNLF